MVQTTRNFDFFDKKPGFFKPFLTNRWRHFGRRFCGWNNCLMVNYCFFQCSKKHGSPTRVTRLKVAPKMADPISFKTQGSSLKYHVEDSCKVSGLLSSFVSSRGVAKLFKMRGGKGAGREADRDAGWRLSIVPCTTCHFVGGLKGGLQSEGTQASQPRPPMSTPLFSR